MTDLGQNVLGRKRPHPNLFKYYLLLSLLFGPLFPFAVLRFIFRYRTLSYDFEDDGVTMRWGVLFRREISLAYVRIQDIHLANNGFERWLGLARVQLQTAAGSATAEMTIEGLPNFEEVRDFLYSRMQRKRRAAPPQAEGATSPSSLGGVTAALREATAEIRLLRQELGGKNSPPGGKHSEARGEEEDPVVPAPQ